MLFDALISLLQIINFGDLLLAFRRTFALLFLTVLVRLNIFIERWLQETERMN